VTPSTSTGTTGASPGSGSVVASSQGAGPSGGQGAGGPPPPSQPVGAAPPTPLVRLMNVRVRDFRGIEDCSISLNDNTVVLGENNVGKSALLEALDIALGDRLATTADLRVRPDGIPVERFVVDLELSPWAGTAFDPVVTDALGIVYRLEPGTGRQRYFLRVIGEPDDTRRTVRLRRGFVDAWTSPVADPFREDLDGTQRRSLWFSLVDAQRDLVTDLRARNSPWGKLLRRLQLDDPTRHALEQQLADLSAAVIQGLPDAARLANAIGRVQSVLAGQVSHVRLAMLPKALSDLWRTADLLIQAAGHPELSIGQQGMGARSLASLLSFHAWLEAEIGIAPEPPLLVVTAFEEPEAHLHPQAQRAVFGEITSVSGQHVISTHSPYVASVARLNDFRVVRRSATVTVRSTEGISSDPFVDQAALSKIRRFCLHRNGDMLFARLVILGEGDTDAGVLPELAKVFWGVRPEERGISIVPMDGAGNARTFATFLERLGIPWVLLLDGDPAGVKEHAHMAQTPLAPLLGARVVLVHDAGVQMDIEALAVAKGRAACVRALSQGNAGWAAGLNSESDAALADRLRNVKGASSRLLGEELAKDWTTRAMLPDALNDLFTKADVLL
jgi:putative ATP-dependent endonuclease of the OLD family